MMRRQWKQWAWAVVAGAAVGGAARAAEPTPDKPIAQWKAGDSVPWRVEGQPEKKVSVVKVSKKPDGSIEAELKDPKTGDTFTIVEGPSAGKPAAPVTPPAEKPTTSAKKEAGPPKAKPRAEDPLTPAATPEPKTPPAADTSAQKKPRLLGRLFGRKPTSTPTPETPGLTPGARQEEPAVAPKVAVPGKPTAPAKATPGADVPAAMPAKPAAVSIPATPARVEPVIPPVPAIPVPLPSIPSPGGGQSAAPLKPGLPVAVVLPAGYVPPEVAQMEDIKPHAVALKTAIAPSQRLLAAKALAGGRHASSDAVKGLLFEAAKADPCPAVRADCLGYLCDLGYFTPAFAEAVKAACDDPSDEVKAAAKAAQAKMARR